MMTKKQFAGGFLGIMLSIVSYGIIPSPARAQWASSGSNIYNTNEGYVGIGTSSPTAKLHIFDYWARVALGRATDTNAISYDFRSSANDELANIGLAGSSGQYADTATAGDWIFRTLTGGDILFATGTSYTEKMRVTAGGNVGIGTTSPSSQLHTTGGVRFAGIASGTESNAVMVNSSGDLSKRSLSSVAFNGEADPIWSSATSSAQTISGGWTLNTNPVTFSGIDILFPGSGIWKSSGEVGVGTTTPVQKLEVNGALKIGDGGTKPTCDSSQRGTIWMDFGDAGVKDTVQVCAKNAAGTYAWRTIY